jgi:putative hydrolase of the HAD superfamily
MLKKLMAKNRLAPGRCVLVEDTVGHLKGARQLGMRTVWITQYLPAQPAQRQHSSAQRALANTRKPAYVDVKLRSVTQLPRHLQRLR